MALHFFAPFYLSSPSLPFASSSSSLIPPFTLHCPTRNPNRKSTGCTLLHIRNKTNDDRPDSDANFILKLAWYGAEALGNVVAAFSPRKVEEADETTAVQGTITRERVVGSIKEDYDKAYFVTGNVNTRVYKEDCEFADPAGSFKSLKRFKNNCSNFGSLLEKSDVKLIKWQEFEDKFVAYWRFSCVLKFPWRPILSSTGFTEYYFDSDSGKICKHMENWDVPKMALLGQVFKPNPTSRRKTTSS